MTNLRLPNINAGDIPGQIRQLVSYLRYLVNELNFSQGGQEKPEEKKGETDAQGNGGIQAWPVGTIFFTVVDKNPQSMLGGRWERIKDVFLLASGDIYPAGSTGGEAQVTLTDTQIPVEGDASGRSTAVAWESMIEDTSVDCTPHNNMPPYLAVYAWKRVG